MPGTDIAITGHPVQSAMAGRVAAVIQDRFPYGNAILIETPLETTPPEWWQVLPLPTPGPTLSPTTALTCPDGVSYEPSDPDRRSLYILYAHLAEPPALAVESDVACGQVVGLVGDSGNALAPHLHFETRAGPAGLRLESMAHYDASASMEEMRSYCLWRISGMFQLVDPNQVLALKP
jgi:murein DD-endopeptidase MepM/ murein hydrolase activator NlpD